MPEYKGQYPLDGELKDGTLFTYKYYETIKGYWGAFFHYDNKEVPGDLKSWLIDYPGFSTEQQTYDKAVMQGFVLSTKEGE